MGSIEEKFQIWYFGTVFLLSYLLILLPSPWIDLYYHKISALASSKIHVFSALYGDNILPSPVNSCSQATL